MADLRSKLTDFNRTYGDDVVLVAQIAAVPLPLLPFALLGGGLSTILVVLALSLAFGVAGLAFVTWTNVFPHGLRAWIQWGRANAAVNRRADRIAREGGARRTGLR